MLGYKKLLSIVSLFFNPYHWLQAIQNPRLAVQAIISILRHPILFIITRNVEGLIEWNVGVLLYETVLRTKCSSSNILEVGSFKGLSTVYLAWGARTIGKRVKSFELFSGLPTADPILDPGLRKGQFSSDVSEYEANLKACGVRDVVDLVIGDARETMLPTLGATGFAVAFLDVDVYEVTRELLFQLWSVVKGGEVIIIHDSNHPGVRKAIDEFHALSRNIVKETRLGKGTITTKLALGEFRTSLKVRFTDE